MPINRNVFSNKKFEYVAGTFLHTYSTLRNAGSDIKVQQPLRQRPDHDEYNFIQECVPADPCLLLVTRNTRS
jgi:hypothetical protein